MTTATGLAGIRAVTELAVEAKRVFVRVDYNVPLAKGEGTARKVGDRSEERRVGKE